MTNVELNVIRLAKAGGARVALLTAHPENEYGQLADLCVRVPGQIFRWFSGGEVHPADGLIAGTGPLFIHRYHRDAAHGKERSIRAGDAGKPHKPRGRSLKRYLEQLKEAPTSIKEAEIIQLTHVIEDIRATMKRYYEILSSLRKRARDDSSKREKVLLI